MLTRSHSFSIEYLVWHFLTFDACFCKINTLLMKALVTNHAKWSSFGSIVADVLQAFHDTVQMDSYYKEGECKLPSSTLCGSIMLSCPASAITHAQLSCSSVDGFCCNGRFLSICGF